MTMADQLTQTETNDRVFTFRDQHGTQTLFDRITGESCVFARHCPNTGTEECDSGEGCPAC